MLGSFTVTISDHLSPFAIISNMLGNISDNKYDIYERNWLKFDRKAFICDYLSVDWEDMSKIDEHYLFDEKEKFSFIL